MTVKKKVKRPVRSNAKLISENEALIHELAEAKETLRAIQNGEVDALVVSGQNGEQIFTLKNADQPYRIFVENMHEGAASLSVDGTIFYSNRCFAELLGVPIEDLIGTSIFDFIKAEGVVEFSYLLSSENSHRRSSTFDFTTSKNQSIPFLISMSPSEIGGGNGVSMIATDMTQQIQIKEYEKQSKELAEAVRARDEFISIASHELKTPLTSLMILSQLQLKMIAKNDPKAFEEDRVKDLASKTVAQTERLNILVGDMLDITRLKSGQMSMKKSNTDLFKLCNSAIERLSAQFISSGCKPPLISGTKTMGYWDPMRIEQVINNLLINAMKYGNNSPIVVTISSTNEVARFSIMDHGNGISQIDQSRIFHRFERAISANEISGLGLGLYISQQIIESHNGKIWVNSENGNGSTFYFELPLGY